MGADITNQNKQFSSENSLLEKKRKDSSAFGSFRSLKATAHSCCELWKMKNTKVLLDLFGRYAHRHPMAYVIPARWNTSPLWARGTTLLRHELSKSMDWTMWSYSLATMIDRPVVSRFLFVEAAEESHLCNSIWIEVVTRRHIFSRCWWNVRYAYISHHSLIPLSPLFHLHYRLR